MKFNDVTFTLWRLAVWVIPCAILALVAPTVRTAQAQPLEIASGNGQSAPINTMVPGALVVRMIDCLPTSQNCGSVSWTSSAPGDTFSPPASLVVCSVPCNASTSTASTQLTLGSTPGPRTVTATSIFATSVTFTITATQAGPATAAASQAATLGSLAVITSAAQTANIGLRLQALRQGATGVSLSGLSVNFAGPSEPPGAVARSSAPADAGAGPSTFPSRLGIFANAQGSFGNQDVTSREPGFDFHTIGVTLGADYRFTDQFVLGLAFAYLRTKLDLDSSAGDSTANGYSLSAYTNYYVMEKLYVDGIMTFGWNTYHTERNNTEGNGTAKGSTDGPQLSLSVGSGYDFNVGALTFGPTGRVDYVRLHIDAYRETGAGPSNAHIDSQTIQSLTTNVGGQAMYAISMGWGVLSPFLRSAWVHEFKGDSRTVTASVGPTSASGQTNDPDRDYFNLGTGASVTFKGGVSAFLDYDVALGRTDFTSHSFTGGVRIEF